MTAPRRILFDAGPLEGGTAFVEPVRMIRAQTLDEAPAALAALEAARAEGFWLAGYAGYELGYLYTDRLRAIAPPPGETPILSFGVFEAPRPHVFADAPAETEAGLTAFEPLWTQARYIEAATAVKELIAAGDIYQANLTFPIRARRSGGLDDLYALLRRRQAARFGALIDLDGDIGGPVILCRSPELFFEVDAARTIVARPMKGTAPRGATPEMDARRARWLRESEKNRAENLMIVDLLRNDISRIAEIGSVHVPKLFTIETYETLHQMTSEVRARLIEQTSLPALFAALFPCGSITGAPKIRAMQILRDLEPEPRGAYCGAVGWAAPNGSMSFGVAIRTLTCVGERDVRLNVGGGVVYDSDPADEYQEALLKSAFARI